MEKHAVKYSREGGSKEIAMWTFSVKSIHCCGVRVRGAMSAAGSREVWCAKLRGLGIDSIEGRCWVC